VPPELLELELELQREAEAELELELELEPEPELELELEVGCKWRRDSVVDSSPTGSTISANPLFLPVNGVVRDLMRLD
jgi:hypothetical protein